MYILCIYVAYKIDEEWTKHFNKVQRKKHLLALIKQKQKNKENLQQTWSPWSQQATVYLNYCVATLFNSSVKSRSKYLLQIYAEYNKTEQIYNGGRSNEMIDRKLK